MIKIKLFFLAVLLTTTNILSQGFNVSGQLIDTGSKEGIPAANVIIVDFLGRNIKGASSDASGKFLIKDIPAGNYTFKTSHIAYKPYQKPIVINRSIDLGKIDLVPGKMETKEVKIIEKIPPVVLKGDTTEINADAFKTNKDADAQDLVTKMPGITTQNGKVQAQGEDVTKVLVDGKPFLGDDPTATLRNIPAEIIEKIQVFDKQSEQSQFTGFDDGNTNKTINIVTRMRFRQGTFGRLAAGYGDEDRYMAGGSTNFFNNEQRLTLLAQVNNLNEQNFASEDLLGVMGNFGGGGGRGGFGGRMPGPGGGGGRFGGGGFGPGGFAGGNFRGGGNPDFLIATTNGLSSTKAFGLNYSDVWGKSLDISGSYFFNNTNSDANTLTNRQYFLSTNTGQNYNESNLSASNNFNNRMNLRLDYTIDSSNSVLFSPKISLQKNERGSTVNGQTSSGLNLLNSVSNLFNSNLTALNTSAELLYRHKFEAKGRTISINFAPSYYKNNGNNKLFSESIYYNDLTSSFPSQLVNDTTDQNSSPNVNGKGGSSNIVYTEPLGENSQLLFNARLSYSEDKSNQETFNKLGDSYSVLDTALSSISTKISRAQSYGTGYLFRKDDFNLMLNLNYNTSGLESEQTFPLSFSVDKSFRSFLPSIMMRYRPSKDQNIMLFYRTDNTEPRVDQLQNVLDNSDPLNLVTGNPDLKQDYRHMIMLHYSKMNMASMNSFFILFSGMFTNNYIGNNTIFASRDTTVLRGILLRQGSKLTIPENLNGYINLRSFIVYGLPVNFIPSNLNFNLSVNYSRTPGLINSLANNANSVTYGLGVVWSSNISQELDITLSANGSYNVVKNSLQKEQNENYYNQNTAFRFSWIFWEGLVLKTDLNHQYDNGLTDQYNRNSVLWNLSLGKKLFSEDRGEIRITAHDILNQNTNVQRTSTSSYIEDTRSNTIGRYFLLSFIYNIREF